MVKKATLDRAVENIMSEILSIHKIGKPKILFIHMHYTKF